MVTSKFNSFLLVFFVSLANIASPCIFLMRNIQALAKDRDGEEEGMK